MKWLDSRVTRYQRRIDIGVLELAEYGSVIGSAFYFVPVISEL